MEANFQSYAPGWGASEWGILGPSSRKGAQCCVNRGSSLEKLYFGRGTQLTIGAGEWVVGLFSTQGKHYFEEIETEMKKCP